MTEKTINPDIVYVLFNCIYDGEGYLIDKFVAVGMNIECLKPLVPTNSELFLINEKVPDNTYVCSGVLRYRIQETKLLK